MGDFRGATFKGKAEFNGARFELQAAFEDCTFEKAVDFVFCRANAVRLGPGRPTILWLVPKRCGGIILRDLTTAQSFWHFACQAFEREGERERADAAYYFERLSRVSPRRIRLEGGWRERGFQIIKRLLTLAFCWFPDCLLLRWSTAYGASLPRLFGTWAFINGGFAGAYYMLSAAGFQVLLAPSDLGLTRTVLTFGGALYFSAATFTTLGYGDVRPAPGLLGGLAAAEAILGGVMMALMVLVIGRKFMR